MAKGNRKSEQCAQRIKAAVVKVKKSEPKEESVIYTEKTLLSKTNADLRDILDTFDGAPSGKSKNKTQLVSLILAEQSK